MSPDGPAGRGRAKRRGGGYVGYSEEARNAAVVAATELALVGITGREVALPIGVHESTLSTWSKAAASSAVELAERSSAFAQVRVAEPANPVTSNSLRLVLPNGGHIDGLDLRTLLALMRVLA